jgi:hypothetical protein
VKLLVSASALALTGACTTLPPSMEVGAGGIQKITWSKGAETEAFRDPSGVCHTFARDTRAALQTLGNQVKACFEGALPEKAATSIPGKAVNVAWNRVPRERVAGVFAQATGQGTVAGRGGRWRSADRLFAIRGFFIYDADTCHVVVPDQPDYVGTLGHEFKHCVDGFFHDGHGDWLAHGDSGD